MARKSEPNMSRTFKDVPYWVRQNREGTLTHHDHLRFGKVYYAYFPVKDEDGLPVYEDVPVYLTAYEVVHGVSYGPGLLGTLRGRTEWYTIPAKPVIPGAFKKAREALGALRPDEKIVVGYNRVRKMQKVVDRVVKDYCTEGEKFTKEDNHFRWYSSLPCTPDIPRTANHNKIYTAGMSGARSAYKDVTNGSSRARQRDILREEAKAWNSGYEVDEDATNPLTDQHRHSIYWELW